MPRWSPWTIAGICLAVTAGVIEAYVGHLLEEHRLLHSLYPRDRDQR